MARGLPLFCDVTCLSPITGRGTARSGATRTDGALLRNATRDNQSTYAEVERAGLGRLCCLGVEVYGRWSSDSLWAVRQMARERSRGLPAGMRRGVQAALLRRWWGLLSIAVQRVVAACVLRPAGGGDLCTAALEPAPAVADLPVA